MKNIFWLGAIVFFLFTGCGPSSYITSSWKSENISPKKFKKIVVLGLVRESDRSVREKMEQHIAGDLRELGYDAVCSCDEYNPKAFEGMNEKDAIAKLRNSGVDAVLTIVLLDKTKEKYYMPRTINYTPYNVYHRRFWGYYSTMQHRIYSEGYYSVDTKYFWESNFYDLGSDQLIYSAQSQSFNPTSIETMGHEYGQLIVKDMIKNNILNNQKEVILKPM
jgi:hypothetical protein